MQKSPRKIVTLKRRRNQIQKKVLGYIKERDRLIKALENLKPPTKEEYEEFTKADLELARHTISLLNR